MSRKFEIREYNLNKRLDSQVIELGHAAMILSAQLQNGHLRCWAKVDTVGPPKKYEFAIVENNMPMSDVPGMYVATFQDSPFVFHIFAKPYMVSQC